MAAQVRTEKDLELGSTNPNATTNVTAGNNAEEGSIVQVTSMSPSTKAGRKSIPPLPVPKFTIEWKLLQLCTKIKNTETHKMETKSILKSVNGLAIPGRLIAIMGPSGAGKSSLLDCLAGRNKNITGSLLVNGKKWDKNSTRRASYIMQDDLFYGTLTVYEHLYFQAQLRMGKNYTNQQRILRVQQVMAQVGLTKCKDTFIGNDMLHGISGGERKRLAFATEILTNPSILFVDEPTSGLDSYMAAAVVQELQNLARGGRTVLATIHQPSYEVFDLFDDLYLLSDGQVIYNGPANESISYFKSLGYECPPFVNPTDYFMQQIIVFENEPSARQRVNQFIETWQTRSTEFEVAKMALLQSTTTAANNHAGKAGGDEGHHDASTAYEDSTIHPFKQLVVLCHRNVTRMVRERLAFRVRFFQSIIISIIIGLIFFQLELSQTGIQNIGGVLFFLVINQTMGAANPEFITVPVELPMILREYRGGLYHAYTWYLAKNISELGNQLLFPAIFQIPCYFLIGFPVNATLYFNFLIIIILASSCGTGLGYLISCMAPRVEIAPVMGMLMLLPFMLFGGLFLNAASTPVYFTWIRDISPMRYSYQALMQAYWGQVDRIPCNSLHCVALTGHEVLVGAGMADSTLVETCLLLLAVNVGFRVIGLFFLTRKMNAKAN